MPERIAGRLCAAPGSSFGRRRSPAMTDQGWLFAAVLAAAVVVVVALSWGYLL
jgi:hypothetical protein